MIKQKEILVEHVEQRDAGQIFAEVVQSVKTAFLKGGFETEVLGRAPNESDPTRLLDRFSSEGGWQPGKVANELKGANQNGDLIAFVKLGGGYTCIVQDTSEGLVRCEVYTFLSDSEGELPQARIEYHYPKGVTHFSTSRA